MSVNIIGVLIFWAIGLTLTTIMWWIFAWMTFKDDKFAPIRLPTE